MKAVLFDHDGTLVDSEECHYQAWCQVLAPFGVSSLTFEDFAKNCIGVTEFNTALWLIERYQLSQSAPDLVATKHRYGEEIQRRDGFPAIAGAMELLQELHGKGVKLAVVSAASQASVMSTVLQYNLLPMLGVVITAADVSNNKPAPDCYLQALERLGVAAEDAVVVEDSANGIASAKAAGLECLAIHHPFVARKALDAADSVFDSYIDIRSLLLSRL